MNIYVVPEGKISASEVEQMMPGFAIVETQDRLVAYTRDEIDLIKFEEMAGKVNLAVTGRKEYPPDDSVCREILNYFAEDRGEYLDYLDSVRLMRAVKQLRELLNEMHGGKA